MRTSILTFPITDVFAPKEGCPVCRMRDTVESHICDYIMGAAMMEPDVREETNELGFCNIHLSQMLKLNNRLSLALMLNTHIAAVREKAFKKTVVTTPKAKTRRISAAHAKTCFVCAKTKWGMDRMIVTLCEMFAKDEAFRRLFAEQDFICLPHYRLLSETAPEHLNKGDLSAFTKALDLLVSDYAAALNHDVAEFCDSFDYRNAGKLHGDGMENVKNSVARAIKFLTGRE